MIDMNYIELPASEIKSGHLVIINEIDCPYGRLAAMVTKVDGENVTARYFCSEVDMDICTSHKLCLVTPLNDFGVVVKHDGVEFHCDVVSDSVATYEDGEIRRWQERGGPVKWPLRQKVLKEIYKFAEENNDA